MTFHWPHAFWLLLVPLVLLVRDLRRRRLTSDTHPKITRAAASHSSLTLSTSSSQRRANAPRTRILLYLALAAATVALARPQWGQLEEPVFDQAREIVIALDLSRSMLADDIKPNRLERARLLITSLLERLKGERVGLIVFSGTAFLQSPLSADYEILREFLPLLEPDYLPEGGTNYDALLETTLTAFGASASADRFLIVLSDGEAQTDAWRKHLDELQTKGIRVLGLGIGTPDGAMIPDGSGAFMKDERGAVVLSKLDPSTLRELADKTNGLYTDASSWVDLSQLIQDTIEQGRRGEFTESNRVRLAERFQWPLAAALVLALLSFWREFPVRPKPRPIQLAAPIRSTVAALCLLPWVLSFGPSSFAAEGTAALSAPVSEIIGRLAARKSLSATDYADLARATATYGERARGSEQPAPESVIRDALAATAAGESLDPKAADWPALRAQLEALLPTDTPPPPKQDPSKSDQQKPEQNKKDQSDSQDQQDGTGEAGDKNDSNDERKSPDESKSPQSNQDSQSDKNGDPSGKKPADRDNATKPTEAPQSAFGDMKDQPPPADEKKSEERQSSDRIGERQQPENPSNMQQVGGASADASTDPARLDPALTVPLQKLEQIKQADSPAQLFQLLRGPSEQPATTGKNW